MKQSETVEKLVTALCKARSEVAALVRNAKGHNYEYADLGELLFVCVPALCKHGIFLTQPVSFEGGRAVVDTCLMLGDEFISSSLSMPVGSGKPMSDAQHLGSAITHGRRYGLSSVMGIAQEDKDAAEERRAEDTAITKEQQSYILARCKELDVLLDAVLEASNVSSIEEIPTHYYQTVLARFVAKEKALEKKGAAA